MDYATHQKLHADSMETFRLSETYINKSADEKEKGICILNKLALGAYKLVEGKTDDLISDTIAYKSVLVKLKLKFDDLIPNMTNNNITPIPGMKEIIEKNYYSLVLIYMIQGLYEDAYKTYVSMTILNTL
jgi:hypothetical protein